MKRIAAAIIAVVLTIGAVLPVAMEASAVNWNSGPARIAANWNSAPAGVGQSS